MPKPKFIHNHPLPFNAGELAELLELARIALSFQPVRMKLMQETNVSDIDLAVLEKKLWEYQEKVKR